MFAVTRAVQAAPLDTARATPDPPEKGSPAAEAFQPSTASAWGIHKASFTSRQGTLTVHLPADARAGDTISGVVIAEPAGATPEERERNRSELTGMVVAVEEQPVPAGSGRGRWLVPERANALVVALRDSAGRAVKTSPIPLTKGPGQTPSGYAIPPIGQAGKPLPILGRFDGDLATTIVTIGDRTAQVLAESPRGLVVKSPEDVSGPALVTVTKRGTEVTRSQEFRNVTVQLSAPRTTLKAGESVSVSLDVGGLAGLRHPIETRLTNETPSARLEGGDRQALTIQPADVGPEGTFHAERVLTGSVPGGFTINAVATLAGDCCEKCHADCKKIHVKCVEGETTNSVENRKVIGTLEGGKVECFDADLVEKTCTAEQCTAWCPGSMPWEWLSWQPCCRYNRWVETKRKHVLDGEEKGKKPASGESFERSHRECCGLLYLTQVCPLATATWGSESVTFEDIFNRLGAKGLKEIEKLSRDCGLEKAWNNCLEQAGASEAFKKALDALGEGTSSKK
jgi:hypothetical protein